jgi:hypothetical protein
MHYDNKKTQIYYYYYFTKKRRKTKYLVHNKYVVENGKRMLTASFRIVDTIIQKFKIMFICSFIKNKSRGTAFGKH